MEAVSPYAKYVLASDLTRNSPRPSIGKRPSDTYHSYFDDPTKDAKTILKEMMDAYAITWNDSDAEAFYQSPDALKSGNTLSGWKQQLTLFDCSRFAPILKAIGGIERFKEQLKQIPNDNPHVYYEESGRRLADFKSAAELVLPQPTEFEAMWRRFAIAKVDNRQGLVWDSDAPSGMLVK